MKKWMKITDEKVDEKVDEKNWIKKLEALKFIQYYIK